MNKDINFNNEHIQKNLARLCVVPTYVTESGKVCLKPFRFCTDDYSGYGYTFDSEFDKKTINNLIKNNAIRTRVSKSKEAQAARTVEKAEVFTPSWICEKMVNQSITTMFTHTNNKIYSDEELRSVVDEIIYERPFTRDEYNYFINMKWQEACCGEAPYIVSRYDTTTGEDINIYNRIGFLDRKLQLISRFMRDKAAWLEDVKAAYKTTYSFEYQGDNLFIARCNLLLTFIDYYKDCFGEEPAEEYAEEIAEIIKRNIIQMDGMTLLKPGKTEECKENLAYYYDWKKADWNMKCYVSYYELDGNELPVEQMSLF